MTRRQDITEVLTKEPHTPKELAKLFMVELREILDDLEHIRRSIHPPLFFKFNPPKCRACGFVFKERLKMKAPSKCPKCRKEDIEEGTYFIEKD